VQPFLVGRHRLPRIFEKGFTGTNGRLGNSSTGLGLYLCRRLCAKLGIGLSAQVGLQVILNIAVVTNTIPNTGISLPFFSYGGTSLVILLAQMGVVLSISRTSMIEKG